MLGKFEDGSTACFKRTVGRGFAYYAGFLPGLSYYEPAIPVRPVDRSSVDSGMNHFLPTEMDVSARELISAPLQGARMGQLDSVIMLHLSIHRMQFAHRHRH